MFKRLRQFLLRDTSPKSCPGGLAVWLQVPALWQRSRELAAAAQEVILGMIWLRDVAMLEACWDKARAREANNSSFYISLQLCWC